jgi:ribosomal-protein-alanine N-acetyltransferase
MTSLDHGVVKRIEEIEEKAFGPAGVDRWSIPLFVNHGRLYLLRDEEQIIGVAQFMRNWDDPNTVFLYGFSIDGAWRGQGLGTYFFSRILELLREDKVERVQLTVDPANARAIGLYEKLGFKKQRLLTAFYGPGVDRWLMEYTWD